LLDTKLVHRDDVGVTECDGRLRLLDETTNKLLIEGELVADLLHDESLLEPARTTQRRQDDACHTAPRELALEDVLAEDLRVQAREVYHKERRTLYAG